MRVFLTGSAGFIGFHLARRLLAAGHAVHGYDGFTPYYDVRLKHARSALLQAMPGYASHVGMLEDTGKLAAAFAAAEADTVVHLAAQAGVRYSLENPRAYVEANLVGTFNLLDLVRQRPPRHLVIASTSSVYGAGTERPFRESLPADKPLTVYAATKRGTELMAHSYAHLYGVPTTILRLFTVYGPWGRPDMAPFRFAAAILGGEAVPIYGEGRMTRDFTYVDDVTEALVRLIGLPPESAGDEGTDSLSAVAPYRVVNVGGGRPVAVLDFVGAFERSLGRKAKLDLQPAPPGDVPHTEASNALLERLTGFRPTVTVEEGVRAFCDWYCQHYGGKPH
ncbi:MAG: NAD-dependent epimerase/dehydratase family protein, partial [Bauldia sp.]